MKKLSDNYLLEKYGLKTRLVDLNDAEFILSLRTNIERTKYMVTVENNIDIQREWIKEYKEREKDGLDYYFIYSNAEDTPIGLNRVSHIDIINKTAKDSSWITVKGLKYEAIKMLIIRNELVFNSLEIEKCWGEVHKENISAIRIFKLFGYKFKDNGSEYYEISIQKDDFFAACNNQIVNNFKK